MKKLSKSEMKKVSGGNNQRAICGSCSASPTGQRIACEIYADPSPTGMKICVCPLTGNLCP